MKFFTSLIVPLAAVVDLALAASETFAFKLDAAGTLLDGDNVYIEDSRLSISDSSSTFSAQVQDDGTLLADGTTMGIGKNYLSLKEFSTSWMIAEPWSIVDGYVKLYGSDFHAVPNGENNGGYVLGSINAAAGRSDMIEVKIKAIDSSGNPVADFVAGDSSSIESSSTEPTSTESTSTVSTSTVSSSEIPTSGTPAKSLSTTFPSSSGSSMTSSLTSSVTSSTISSSKTSSETGVSFTESLASLEVPTESLAPSNASVSSYEGSGSRFSVHAAGAILAAVIALI